MWNPFKSTSNPALDEFARALVTEVTTRYTPEMAAAGKGKKAEARLGKALEVVERRVEEYRRANKLGVYGKARVGNTFKWELKERGYDAAFVEDVTRAVIMSLSRK